MATAKGKTNAQLVEEYNALGPAKPLKNWKGKKADLIAKINSAKKQSSAVEKPATKKRTGAIRQSCESRLRDVAYHENKSKDVGLDNQLKRPSKNTRPVGYSFADILGAIHDEFPEASTSYACLRWYAVHMRRAGEALPRRPKSSWK